MTIKEYINLYHDNDIATFVDVIYPAHVNAFWTSNGESYYPCILLDDSRNDDCVYIVTRNQTIMHHPRKCVFKMEEIEKESSRPIPIPTC